MASPAMENSENLQEVSEVQQANKSWDDTMEEVEADDVNEQESRRTTLIAPQEDDVPVPDAIDHVVDIVKRYDELVDLALYKCL